MIYAAIYHISLYFTPVRLSKRVLDKLNYNSGLNFRNFHVPNETIHSGCTDQTQATGGLVIVLVSRIQKIDTWDNSFVKRKGTFRYDRSK